MKIKLINNIKSKFFMFLSVFTDKLITLSHYLIKIVYANKEYIYWLRHFN